MKLIYKILFSTLIFTTLSLGGYGQFKDEKPISSKQKNGSFKKKTFSTSNTGEPDRAGAPGPGGGGGGFPVPISGGMFILIGGSSLYFYRRIKDDRKKNKKY